MNPDTFWSIVETARKYAKGDGNEFIDRLSDALAKLPPAEIAGFNAQMHHRLNEAFTWPLWGAAYLMCGGCSDDGFEYFRCWLIGQGRKTFEQLVKDPDSAATLDLSDEDVEAALFDYESLLYAPGDVYRDAADDEELPDDAFPKGPAEPKGERWNEDNDDLEKLLPKLAAKYAANSDDADDEDGDDTEDEADQDA